MFCLFICFYFTYSLENEDVIFGNYKLNGKRNTKKEEVLFKRKMKHLQEREKNQPNSYSFIFDEDEDYGFCIFFFFFIVLF
jgi:hypothetical protein